MPYTVSSDTVGLAIGPVSESTNDVREALNKARQMYEAGLVNVCIRDGAGRCSFFSVSHELGTRDLCRCASVRTSALF
jgi:hypothetical protein